jgi:DNA invertase Pin-like site-specific DNA recombinase
MKKKGIAVYVRVSSMGQDLRSQEPDLKIWVRAHGRGHDVSWYHETFTGKTLKRPVMDRLEESIRAGKVGTLVVWRLDRLGRTAVETLRFLDDLEAAGVRFVSVRDGVDAGTASGRLLRTILAGFAEYEREVISERIRAGITRARAAGKRWGGRKQGLRPKLTPKTLRSIRALLKEGTPKAEVARQLQLDRSTVYDAMRLLRMR